MSLQREATVADFERISWHDNEIYGLAFRTPEPDAGDWRSELVLDIDYIVEWVPPRSGDSGLDGESDVMRFRVAPATLVFHDVTDLRIEVDGRLGAHRTSVLRPSISVIERELVRDQKVALDRAYYAWRIRLNTTPDGEISFGASGFTQTLRREPVLCDEQRLPQSERGGPWTD